MAASKNCCPANVIEILLQGGADVNAADNGGETALMHTICVRGFRNKVETIKTFLRSEANVNAANKNGRTAWMTFSERPGHKRIVEIMVQAGSNINAIDGRGITPLMRASANPDVAKVLLQAGADTNMIRKGGKTALAITIPKFEKNGMKGYMEEVYEFRRRWEGNDCFNALIYPSYREALRNDTSELSNYSSPGV